MESVPPFHPSPYESNNLAVTVHWNCGAQKSVVAYAGVDQAPVSPTAQISRTL